LVALLPPSGESGYAVLERTVHEQTARRAVTVRIAIPDVFVEVATIATLAAAARREIGSAQAIVIFAYRTLSESGGPFTVGRAYLSDDGRGWSGDGMTEDGPDRREIVGSVVRSMDPLVLERFRVAR